MILALATSAALAQSYTTDLGLGSVASGDVNGDGYDDMVAGASAYANGQNGEGAVYVWFGSVSGLEDQPSWRHESDLVGGELGASVAVGDVNGDGYDDVLAGAPGVGSPWASGRAYLFLGSPTGPSATPDWTY